MERSKAEARGQAQKLAADAQREGKTLLERRREASEKSRSSRRWIVFASTPVVSVRRFAALPVGAHRQTV